MGDADRQHSSISEYYRSEAVTDKYVSTAGDGLMELEQKAVDRYFTDPGARVLDLGCGGGRTTTELERMGFDTVAVDLVKSYVEHARSLVPAVDFSVADATSLPFDDETFRYALFSYNGIDDIAPEQSRYEALREVFRVLEPGGIFTFSSHNLWSTYVVRSLNLEGVRKFIEFWRLNARPDRLFSRYKNDNTVTDGPRPMYYIRPSDQKQQLRNCGFTVLDVLRTDGLLKSFFHHPHYVAEKPESPR